HGVALVPERNLGFATSGRANEVVVFDTKTLQTQRKIKSGQNPDAILYDPASKKVFALCGRSGDATVIDPAHLDKPPASLPIGGLSANGGDGTLTVVREGADGKYAVAQTVMTVKTAKTIAGDPQSHRAYLPATVPGENGGAAAFGILVVGPTGKK